MQQIFDVGRNIAFLVSLRILAALVQFNCIQHSSSRQTCLWLMITFICTEMAE